MSQLSSADHNGAWRSGYRLMMRKGAALPSACIKCAQPKSVSTVRKTYYWQPPGFFRFLPFPISLIVVVVALVSRQKITVDVPLCALHRRKLRVGIILTCLFCGLGLVAIGVGLNSAITVNGPNAENAPVIILAGIVLMSIGGICFVFAGRLLSLKQIDDETATFSGASARFLQLLPDSPNLTP